MHFQWVAVFTSPHDRFCCENLNPRAAAFFEGLCSSLSQITEGHISVRANLGDGAHALRLPGQRVDVGQWVLVSLSRYDNMFTLRLEHGGGSREVQARLGSRREIVVHPSSLMVGNGPDKADFQGESWI